MKDQIKEILSKERLSSSQFADKIGIQRSSISHVLSGRNKPGFDFIQKILVAFPNINGEWLITGSGEMYKQKSTSTSIEEPPVSEKTIEFSHQEEKRKIPVAEDKREKDKNEIPTKRKIERVIVFYNDKTFTEYHAET